MKWVVMIVGIVMLMWVQIMPSSAQPECWNRIISCLEGVKTRDEFQQQCCRFFIQEITEERECFCSVQPNVSRNPDLLRTVNSLLSFCGTQSFNTICPGPTSTPIGSPPSPSPPPAEEEGSCWGPIVDCIRKNANRSETEPELDPSSPRFNATEFYCCPLLQQAVLGEKRCFCAINTVIKRNPSRGGNITAVLSTCNVVDSATALDNFCQAAETPTTAPAPSELLSLLAGNN